MDTEEEEESSHAFSEQLHSGQSILVCYTRYGCSAIKIEVTVLACIG